MSKSCLLNEFLFGFELEGTYDSRYHSLHKLKEIFDTILGGEGDMHSDGSLRVYDRHYETFEYSTPVLNFNITNIKKAIFMLDYLPSLNVKINKTCGFHTHISFPNITKNDAIWTMLYLVASKKYNSLLKFGRTNFYRTPFAKKGFLHSAEYAFESNDINRLRNILISNEKYRCIRIHPQGTIEWRGPRTFLNTIKHSKNVKFFKKLAEFMMLINEAKNIDHIGSLTRESFIKLNYDFNFKEYNFNSLDSLFNRIIINPNILNKLPINKIDELFSYPIFKNNFDTIAQSFIKNNLHLNNDYVIIKMVNSHLYHSLVKIVDINKFMLLVPTIGSLNGLTNSYTACNHILHNQINFRCNDEECLNLKNNVSSLIDKLENLCINNFGKSEIKTFSYNVINYLATYKPTIIEPIFKLNIKEIFNFQKATSIINNYLKSSKSNDEYERRKYIIIKSPNNDILANDINNLFIDNNILFVNSDYNYSEERH